MCQLIKTNILMQRNIKGIINMNNNMIKVLAVVVIAGGLWWFMSGDPAADCVAGGGTWTEAKDAVVCEEGATDCVASEAVEAGCTPAAE